MGSSCSPCALNAQQRQTHSLRLTETMLTAEAVGSLVQRFAPFLPATRIKSQRLWRCVQMSVRALAALMSAGV